MNKVVFSSVFSCCFSIEVMKVVLHTCLYLACHLADRTRPGLVGKLMNQGIRVLLPLVDRDRCLSSMPVCSVILGQSNSYTLHLQKPIAPSILKINFQWRTFLFVACKSIKISHFPLIFEIFYSSTCQKFQFFFVENCVHSSILHIYRINGLLLFAMSNCTQHKP